MTYTIPDYAKAFVPQAQTDWQLYDAIRYAIKGTSTEDEAAFGLRFMDWWRIINIECFESRLQPLFISREVASYGHWIGLCQYTPTRHIKLAWAAFSSGGHHEQAVGNRLPGFDDLTPSQHNAAMVVLHEMMHQSLFEANEDTDHDSVGWAALCKYLGGVLGLPYDYTHLKLAKVPVLDADGNIIRQLAYDKAGEPVMLANGKQKTVQVRTNVRIPSGAFERDESRPLAPYGAYFCFPYCSESAFIQANTTIKTSGKAVDDNDGKPVNIPPQF